MAAEVLGAVRKVKTQQQRSLRADVERIVVHDTPARLARLMPAREDVREAARARVLDVVEDETARVDVELTAPDAT